MKKILLIEDYQPTVEMVTTLLEIYGYSVEVARDGVTGLSKAEKDRPDLILLDIMLPIMDGFEVSKRLKENETTKTIPVIVVSIKADLINKDDFKDRVDAYLTKPFEPQKLIDLIKSVLGN
ncbi:MAG: response regulator [Candidatus Margulisbacteria bacterium]|nr:response regulator [Candidatus Margulisiibacteriota bacterium]MBU1617002.1 response regulator [Candidatus Margulisiibacteriota bacterium]MBU1867270.1 response regulator [Candidatus Margulisiibacteriota bacterium]